jgi:hypothetical protein
LVTRKGCCPWAASVGHKQLDSDHPEPGVHHRLPRTISTLSLSPSEERRCAGQQRRMSACETLRYWVYS